MTTVLAVTLAVVSVVLLLAVWVGIDLQRELDKTKNNYREYANLYFMERHRSAVASATCKCHRAPAPQPNPWRQVV